MAALPLGGMLGWIGYHPTLPPEGSYTVRGTVIQEIHLREDGQVQTVLSDVTVDGMRQKDAYWTYYLAEGEKLPDWLAPGVQLSMNARVYHPSGRQNPGGFDFRAYLLQQGITIGVFGAEALVPVQEGFSLKGTLAALRHRLTMSLLEVMGEEAGAYAAAMLLGTRDYIAEDDRAAFNELGIAHILSVSGYHVGVLCGMLMFLLRPLPIRRRTCFLLEALLLSGYCLLTGGSAPVVRAALLLLWREFTHLRHQQMLPLHFLCTTALVQLIFNPTLAASASFQLTYGAMLGLLVVYPWLKRRLVFGSWWGTWLWEAFAAAVSAQLGILFPQLYWFGRLPVFSVVINMAVMALSGGLMTLYWLTLAALPVPGLRELLGSAAQVATAWMLTAVRTLAALDLSTLWTRQPDGITLVGCVLVLLALSSLLPTKLVKQRRKVLLLGTLLVAALLLPLPEHRTTYTQFSVGDADAAILQDREMTVVIDVGEDGQELAGRLHRERQSVEMLILTHLHIDHAGGIRALLEEDIPVESCYLPVDADVPMIDEEVLPLLRELADTGTVFHSLHRGDVIPLPSGKLTVLWPEAGRVTPLHDANDVGLVLQADIAGVTMLLTGDLSGQYESCIQCPADILKVAHHGSAGSTSAAFLSAVDPQVVLLSNASESRTSRMKALVTDAALYVTEEHGAVTVTFLGDGKFEVRPFLEVSR